jgi:oligopeptide/dipeptide ABC transporter ATP-binding protein
MNNRNRILLDVKNLKKHFPLKQGLFKSDKRVLKAVDDISLQLHEGETLGLVGESGCGKTTAGRTILRLYKPSSGEILMNTSTPGENDSWEDLSNLSYRELKRFRHDIQVIYQDPYGSLNPRMNIGSIVKEPLKIHKRSQKSEWNDRAEKIMKAVGLEPEYMKRYPHEFSGGQRQRIAIARALVLEPKIIIADEPVSALDVSIQAQVLNLLKDLQGQFDLTYLFIAHDLGVVRHISNRIAVMYLGKIVEMTDSATIFDSPGHPYTEALLSAVPVADPDREKNQILLNGDVPSPIDPPSGCHFHPRCPYARDICSREIPELTELSTGHSVSCIRAGELSLQGVSQQ